MAKTFKVSIVTAEQTLLEVEAVSLTLPGIAGYLGILANHAPLVTALVPGVLTLRENDGSPESVFAVTNGFVEVARNEVSVMVDACEPAQDIDVTRAEAALEKAKERLAHRADHNIDVTRADAAMARAKARLMASRKLH
jgi:F-type H+-transporting ATPase subunit epsilon